MTAELIGHLWQSTFFALAAGLLTLAFRKNRAGVRYWVWLSASLKFFVPFALLLNLGRYLETLVPAARQIATPAVSYTIEQFSGPFFPDNLPVPASAPETIHWMPIATLAIWLCGFAAVALVRFRNWLRVRAAVHASTATNISAAVEVRVSPGLLEPGVVGLVRPILLLPEGIAERLTPSELSAVLAHELCHIRRGDNLFAALHMMVEAIFWFHPLVWWIGARLIDERERACDEEVLRQGNQPEVYAGAILNVCKLYVESPIACVSGVSGAGIRRRVEAIMSNRKLQGLNQAKRLLLATAGIAALAGPIAIGLLIGVGSIPAIHAQPARAAQPTPGFEVASIKLCKDGDFTAGRGGGGGFRSSPGSLIVNCETIASLIPSAYLNNAERAVTNPHYIRLLRQPLKGGPSWIDTDRYRIEAKAEGSPSASMMTGPMMRALLESRFQLKTHRDTRQVPVYALTVATGGPKLQATQKGSCMVVDWDHPFSPPEDQPMPRVCGGVQGTNDGLTAYGQTMAGLCYQLQGRLDRDVVDRTGIPGMFDIHLEAPRGYLFAEAPSDAAPPDPADIFAAFQRAVQKLGLRLDWATGADQFLVIDHIERPSEN